MVLFATYLGTAAPDLSFWDAAEFTAAAHTFGIPHPPGTPLWVAMGKLATLLFTGTSPARMVTVLAVWCAAMAGGLGAWLVSRWAGARAGVVSAVMAGTMYTVWSQATEAEVYAAALLLAVAMLVAGDVAGSAGDAAQHASASRARGLLAFFVGLALPLHLSALVALPAAVALASSGARPTKRDLALWAGLCLLGLSAVAILPLRSLQNPAMDSGNPESWRALLAVLQREQYEVAGLLPRRAPLWLQIGNLGQWADWQVGFGLHPYTTAAWPRTLLTLTWLWLAALGLRSLWRQSRRVGRAMLLLVLSASLGVVVWLNLRAGPSFGVGVLPDGALHEARERDYFFVLAFWTWGLLAGVGLASMAAALGRRLPRPLALLPLTFALVPLLANRRVADRTREPVATLPRSYARLLLDAVPTNGVLFTAGDNDSFPLWYLQQVEDYRSDVSVVTVPLLGATWYREQLAARGLLDSAMVHTWPGLAPALQMVQHRAAARRRAVRVSTMLAAADRKRVAPSLGWRWEGLVWSPSDELEAGAMAIDYTRSRRAAEQMPRGVLAPLPSGSDPAARAVQGLLRCLAEPPADLLVSDCSGA